MNSHDVELANLRNIVYKMVGKELTASSGRTHRRYELNDSRKGIKKKTEKEFCKHLIINTQFLF